MKNEKFLVANLTTEQTYLEMGRIFYCILNSFAISGYKILLLENEKTKSVTQYGKHAFEIKELKVVNSIPDYSENYTLLYDQNDSQINGRSWIKQIHLKYDLYSPYWLEQPIVMPFPVHPLQYVHNTLSRLIELRQSKKSYRVLFAGDTKNYRRKWVYFPKEKLPRLDIVNTLFEKFSERIELVNNKKSYHAIMNSVFLDKYIVIDNDAQRIDSKIWFDVIAKSHFFLSPPGIVMPMCHNIVEAMGIGVIPITNYPEWFHPNLEHGKNCIVFDNETDILEKMKYVFSLDEDVIAEMSSNVIKYYEDHLKPEQFIKKVEESEKEKVTVLYYTEGNVAKNKKKLNKHSVLMRDTSVRIDKSSLRYKIMKLLGRG